MVAKSASAQADPREPFPEAFHRAGTAHRIAGSPGPDGTSSKVLLDCRYGNDQSLNGTKDDNCTPCPAPPAKPAAFVVTPVLDDPQPRVPEGVLLTCRGVESPSSVAARRGQPLGSSSLCNLFAIVVCNTLVTYLCA